MNLVGPRPLRHYAKAADLHRASFAAQWCHYVHGIKAIRKRSQAKKLRLLHVNFQSLKIVNEPEVLPVTGLKICLPANALRFYDDYKRRGLVCEASSSQFLTCEWKFFFVAVVSGTKVYLKFCSAFVLYCFYNMAVSRLLSPCLVDDSTLESTVYSRAKPKIIFNKEVEFL